MPTAGSVRSTGAPREGQGCPQRSLPSPGCSSTDGLSLGDPRDRPCRPLLHPAGPHTPGVPVRTLSCSPGGDYLVSRGTSLRVLTHRRVCGTQEGQVTSEGPCRCPQVPVLSHGAAKGRGSDIAPAPLFAQRWAGFTATGLDWGRRRPAVAGHAVKHVWPRQPDSGSFHMPRRRDVGSQETGEEERQLPNYFGDPQGFALDIIRSAQKLVPADFRILPLNPWCSQGSLHPPNPQPRHPSLPPNEPSQPPAHPAKPPPHGSPWILSKLHIPGGLSPSSWGRTLRRAPPAPAGRAVLGTLWTQITPWRGVVPNDPARARPRPKVQQPLSKAEPPPFLWDPSLSPSPGDTPRVKVLPLL